MAFVVRELATDAPIVNLRVLANRNFAIGTALITVLGVVLYGTTALLPLFLQTLLGYPALQSGLAVSPRGLGALTASILVGRLIGRIDSRLLIGAGFGLAAGSALIYSRMNLDIAQRDVVWTSVMNGFAGPLIFVPLTTTAMGTLGREQMGQGTGIFNLMRNIGASVGIATVTTLLTRGTQAHQARLVAHLTPYDPGVPALAGGRPGPPDPAGGVRRRRVRRPRAPVPDARQAGDLALLPGLFPDAGGHGHGVPAARPAVPARSRRVPLPPSSTETPGPRSRRPA